MSKNKIAANLNAHCRFEDTLEFDHIGLPAQTAVYTMLSRYAAIIGQPLKYRAVVSTFDASLRCVRANLGLAIAPREIAEPIAPILGIEVVPLSDDWARRRFALCFRSMASLSPAARVLVEHLTACVAGEDATTAKDTPTGKRAARKASAAP
ncbi:hypothethical protein [Ralstonia solanacearum PSI07]|nr:hypothethical protein [Ralstonia solanacearum PSI07]